ncbi:MAG: flagellar basal-body MS-ring/collar protein FliF [Novosphingobium sp.]|nr:flagellar basal-body MS-ring/collar protein FliF [Novosphingobium sp.]
MQRRQIIVFGTLFTAVVGVLALVYFAFLRPGYAVLYEDIREADAAQIVGELEKQGIPYRLADDGHRVLVPEDEVDRARVTIAGSGIAMGGVVGFELFNDADMGLTEFAEKVNYQRALQGELARTIMMMDGISFARVHLSLPERSLFRTARTGPKAAVTIQAVRGRPLQARQVEGIQRLIASTVAELSARDVAVLDDKGDLISPSVPTGEPGAMLDERGALEAYFRARAQSAAEKLLPGVPFAIRVAAQGWAPGAGIANSGNGEESGESGESGDGSEKGQAGERNFSLRAALRTEADLNEDNRSLLRSAIGAALALDPAKGDVLRFETGPLDMAGDAQWDSAPAPSGALRPDSPALPVPSRTAGGNPVLAAAASGWFLLLLAGLALGIVILLRRRPKMDDSEQATFADLLATQLEGAGNG